MPTNLNNQANITYTYAQCGVGAANSNIAITTLLDDYGLMAEKQSLTETFRPGQNLTYLVTVQNTGTQPLESVTITDSLGIYDGLEPLHYIPNSARLIMEEEVIAISPTIVSDQIQFLLPWQLPAQATVLLIYMVTVAEPLLPSIDNIVNVAVITGIDGSGKIVAAEPSPSATVTAALYANVSIYKEADKHLARTGETLTYTFTLSNTGNEKAKGVVMTDTFPVEFTVISVESSTEGSTTIYTPQDYTINSSNMITLPCSGSPLSICVPAATDFGPGITTIVISGVV